MFNALVRGTLAVAIAAVAITGCGSSTKMTDQWKDPSYAAGPMDKVVVMGLDLPPASRRAVEDRFASDLTKQGVQATPSYSVFGDQLPDREAARTTLASKGFDGVLVLQLERVSEQTRFVPGDNFYGTPYGTYWASPYGGQVVTDEIVNIETSLWDLHDGKRVWTANTKTENPSSGSDVAKDLSKKVLPELSAKGLIVKSD